MTIKELEKRIIILEEKISLLENEKSKLTEEERVKPSQHDTFKRENTVHPMDLEPGRFAYVGHYVNEDGSTFRFGADSNRINSCLNGNVNEMANVLEAFSSPDRLEILRSLLKRRMSAKELMVRLNMSTTGKLYHHLSKLQDLGLIEKKGEMFNLVGKSAASIILIFTAAEKTMRNVNV